MKPHLLLHSLLITTLSWSAAQAADPATPERGRYLLTIGGCHDCHTPGYLQTGGEAPEALWLTGNPVGFQGPWGTTYPTNLRLLAQSLSETQWLERVRQPMRPPMPWFNLRHMDDQDLLAMYEALRQLGPAGEPAPQAVPPGGAVLTSYIDFTPRNPPKVVKK